MFRNYLAAALRNFARNRLYAAINVVGLSIGFAAVLLIGLFVWHETTFDRFIPGHEASTAFPPPFISPATIRVARKTFAA